MYESAVPTPDTRTIARRRRGIAARATREELGCPEWCTLAPEDHDDPRVVSDEDCALVVEVRHVGPKIGHFVTDAFSHNAQIQKPWAYLDMDRIEFSGPKDLRRLAAEATATAEWLEARQ